MKVQGVGSLFETPRGLICLFALGLAIRLVLAHISEGLWFDVTLFRLWSNRLVEHGLAGFYTPTTDYTVDYPPGYLYILLALGKISRALLGGPPSVAVLKLPAILSDVAAGALAVLLAARVTPAEIRNRIPVRAMAAAAVLFNPALIMVSAVWGQVDSLLALVVFATAYALAGPPRLAREMGAVASIAVGVATKPQVIFAAPVVAVLVLWRHRSDGWSLLTRCALLGGVAATIVVAMFIPFGVTPIGIVRFYRNASALYPFTSLWAFNFWGIAGFYRPDVGVEAVRIGGVAALYVGLIGFATMAVVIVAQCWRSLTDGVEGEAVVLFGAAAMTCAGFALLTRTHERYLYLAVAALAPLVGHSRLRFAFAMLSLCLLINVHFVYVFHSQHASPPGGAWTIQYLYDAFFGHTQDAFQLKILSILTTSVCLAVGIFGWEWFDRDSRAPQSTATVAVTEAAGKA